MNDLPLGLLELRVGHRQWNTAFSEAFAILSMASPGDVVCIVGPSRAGKSRLIGELRRQLENGNRFDVTGLLPVVAVEAVNAGPNGTFSTKGFTLRMLEAVRHPMLSLDTGGQHFEVAIEKIERTTENSLRQALERAFRHRGTRYLFIDEAQHVRYTSRQSMAPCAVMDSWKCLAQASGLVLVVVGAYPILELLRNSPHMLGRKKQIHLARYTESQSDLLEFAKIIRAFEQVLTGYVADRFLVSQLLFLHHRTCGCIGLLKGWLTQAMTLAHVRGQQIDLALLEEAAMPDSEILEIDREISEGERLLYCSPSKAESIPNTRQSDGGGKSRRKPFTRSPKRYERGHRSGDGDSK